MSLLRLLFSSLLREAFLSSSTVFSSPQNTNISWGKMKFALINIYFLLKKDVQQKKWDIEGQSMRQECPELEKFQA